jgi:iron complex outermembrane receptor protein
MKWILCIVLLVGTSGTLTAQTEQADTVRYQMPPITVTATRVTESWIEVPLAVSVVPVEGNLPGKGYGFDEVLSGIPGVLVQSRYGNQDVRLTIRGFGARGAGERSNSGTSRGVRILTNGFPDTEPDGRTSFDLIDLSSAGSIEVVRSNASAMYGNASGGVVNVLSYTDFDQPYAGYRSSVGSYGFHKEMVNAGAMLGTGRMYLSFSNTTAKGWRAHSNSSQVLFNSGVLAPLGERTNLGVHLSATSNNFRIPGPLTEEQYITDPSQAQNDARVYSPTYVQRDERRLNKLGRLGMTVSHELSEENLIEATAFVQPKVLQRSERNTFRDFNRYHVGGSAMFRNTHTFGEGVRNTFIAGIDEAYQDGAILFYSLVLPQTSRGTLRDNKREGANNFGTFIQNEFSPSEHVAILAGVRYDNISYYSEGFFAPPAARLSETKSFERFTPKLGITYLFTPTHSVYANYGGGVEVPAGNETDPAPTSGADTVYAINPLLEPIRSNTVEVGTKQVLNLGGDAPFASMMYDVALFWIRVTNDIIPYRGGRFYFTAGRSDRMGLEASTNLQLRMGLSFNLALTVSSNKYKEYLVDSVHYSPSKAGHVANYADNTIVGMPDTYFQIGVKYAPPMLKSVYVNANVQNVGKYYVNDANTIIVPAHTIFNAGIGVDRFRFAGDRLYVSAFAGVNNLTGVKYIGSTWLNPDAPVINGTPTPAYIEPGLPRNVVATIGIGMNL